MSRYLIRRIVTAIPTLLLISFVLYAILSLAPGDPLSQFAANPAVPPEVRDNIRRSLGLDDPWPVRRLPRRRAGVTRGDRRLQSIRAGGRRAARTLEMAETAGDPRVIPA